jgi:NAD(P)-dependent dehydrogenase (short-subunit alcohol dehydrogenase family)
VLNNAGVAQAGFFLTRPQRNSTGADINLGGVVNGCRSSARRLVDRGPAVTSSTSPRWRPTPVNAMNVLHLKAAVYMFSDCLRAELERPGSA